MTPLNPSFAALNNAFTQYLQTLGFAATTCYDYAFFASKFLLHLQQQNIHHIALLTTKTIFHYFEHLEQTTSPKTRQPLGTAHLNRCYCAIDKFLTFLHHSGAQNTPAPTKHSLPHQPLKTLQVLTVDEVQQLYQAIQKTFASFQLCLREPRQAALQLILNLCYGCGLRRSEAVNLKTAHLNFNHKTIHVKQGKGGSDRFVPMNHKIYEALQQYVYSHHRTFCRRKEFVYPFGSRGMDKAFKTLLTHCSEQIQNKQPTLHTLRHSIATHLLQNGMPVEQIAKFLGHTSLEATQIYTHITHEL
jgi:integrase/recombinase XerD